MTKSEVRAVTLAKARLDDSHIIWDIGAGTGSISVEAALMASHGEVYAVEKKPEAVELIRKNMKQFDTPNIIVCAGTAPEALVGLPAPDRVFVGGSGGNFREILGYVYEKLPSGGRVVINAVALETLINAAEAVERYGFRAVEVSQISVARTADVGRVRMFRSHNPVFIISGEK